MALQRGRMQPLLLEYLRPELVHATECLSCCFETLRSLLAGICLQ